MTIKLLWALAFYVAMAMLSFGRNPWLRFLNSEGGGPGTRTLAEAREELTTKQDRMALVFEEARQTDGTLDLMKATGLKDQGDNGHERSLIVAGWNDELTEIGKEVGGLQGLKDAETENAKLLEIRQIHPEANPEGNGDPKLWVPPFSQFVKTDAFKSRPKGAASGQSEYFDVGIKELMLPEGMKADFASTVTLGWPPQAVRSDLVVLDAQRQIAIADIIPVINITQNAYVYMEETVFTNAAAETLENTAYPEATLTLAERTSTVRKIPVILPVTDEQLEDVPAAEEYVNRRLTFMIRQRLDSQLIVGDGIAPNLEGVLNVTGIGSQAKAADDTLTAFYKAITLVRANGFTEPNAAVVHPTDWQDIATLQTSDGAFLWGHPSQAGPERMWGLPIVITTAITLNTGLVGDFRNFSLMASRRGIDLQVGFDGTDFSLGRRSIRADLRTAFVVTRPSAFAEITGI